MNTQNLNEIHNALYAGLDEGRSQKEVPVTTKTFTDDEVYTALQGKNSLDALLVWRMAEAAHGITAAQKGYANDVRGVVAPELLTKLDRCHSKPSRAWLSESFNRGAETLEEATVSAREMATSLGVK